MKKKFLHNISKPIVLHALFRDVNDFGVMRFRNRPNDDDIRLFYISWEIMNIKPQDSEHLYPNGHMSMLYPASTDLNNLRCDLEKWLDSSIPKRIRLKSLLLGQYFLLNVSPIIHADGKKEVFVLNLKKVNKNCKVKMLEDIYGEYLISILYYYKLDSKTKTLLYGYSDSLMLANPIKKYFSNVILILEVRILWILDDIWFSTKMKIDNFFYDKKKDWNRWFGNIKKYISRISCF